MYTVLGLFLLLPCLGAQHTTSAQNATAFALTYGYPLLAFQNFADQFLKFNATNYLYNTQELSSPTNRTVVKPNVDTLYSAALLDLSQSDVLLSVPGIPASQYVLFSFYDIFGDNYANVGSGNVNGSGKYRVRSPQNGTFEYGVRPQANDSSTPYVADVLSPTTYGILLVRWGVNSSSINMVHQFQAHSSLSAMNATGAGNVPNITVLGTPAIYANTTMSPAEKCLSLLAKYAPWNQPETEAAAKEVNIMLADAGISNGTYLRPAAVDLNAANASTIEAATNSGLSPSSNKKLNNGWSITAPGGLQGNFKNGTDYAYRAAVASAGFLQLVDPNAIYPSWSNASAGGSGLTGALGYSLARDEAVLYTFSAKPPLIDTGFWSLTAYIGNYLIPNSLNRYAIGDRSPITYPDGSMVYGSNASQSEGSFQILVQAADNPPPANWTSNWLPGPASGGNVTAILRFYGAEEPLLNADYQYPVVTKQAAITNSSSGSTNATSGSGAPGTGSGTMPSPKSSSPSSSPSMSAGSSFWTGESSLVPGVMALAMAILVW